MVVLATSWSTSTIRSNNKSKKTRFSTNGTNAGSRIINSTRRKNRKGKIKKIGVRSVGRGDLKENKLKNRT